MDTLNSDAMDNSLDVDFSTGIDYQAQYEAFWLYSAFGGQEGIPRNTVPPIDTASAETPRPVVSAGIFTPQLSAQYS